MTVERDIAGIASNQIDCAQRTAGEITVTGNQNTYHVNLLLRKCKTL